MPSRAAGASLTALLEDHWRDGLTVSVKFTGDKEPFGSEAGRLARR